MKGNNTRRWSAALAVVIITGAVYWFQHDRGISGSNAPAAGQGPRGPSSACHGRFGGALAPVQATTATEQVVPRYLTGLGTVTTANTMTIRSRVDGQLLSLHFQEGQQVKAGDLLAQIDPSQFKVALAQAQGQLAKGNTTLMNARRDLARYQQLMKTNLVSHQELDTQQSLVVESTSTVKADEAAVVNTQLQLDWARVTTPIDGRIGLKQMDIGNQIFSGGTTGIAVLAQTYPVDVVFTLPESGIATVVQARKTGRALSVKTWDHTNKQKISAGELLSLGNQIDAITRAIELKARFSNLSDALSPSQFVSARLLVDAKENAVVIPVAALWVGNGGHLVWVLNDENRVSKHSVTPGIQDNQRVIISTGLSAGDRVAADGIDRLTEGVKVEVVIASDSEQVRPASRQGGKHGARS